MNDETARGVLPAQASALPPGFFDLVHDLKAIVRGAHVRAQLKVNTEMLLMYWEIGRTILARQQDEKWGTGIIGRISAELRTEFPNQRGFSTRNVKYMRQLARTWPEQFGQQAAAQLPWGHLQLLMDKCETRFELDFYAQHAVHHGWSRDHLGSMIHTALHRAKGAAANNFDVSLPESSDAVKEVFKDPYRLDFTELTGRPAERDLEDALVANLVRFLTELGVGFAFVGRQYPVVVGDTEFRIDLLFYHCKLHCYVVLELKTRKAHPEHFGQLGFYVSVVDDLVRDKEVDGPTVGILIAESRDRSMVEYALRGYSKPLAVSTYAGLPERVQGLLPSAEDLSRIADDVLRKPSGGA
ncbi:PDDEXK nuclease domain-containing protein [Streptomyces sp. NBC_00963]|uniref:PDDEXK nuclease domain-containing protein n=1 Tax=unclassified Streptomyces TaxID=2593676 RepID=UPI0022518AE4|nr:PDDEXK nuclease domain-containing protein [Streptomyces sp. NBC_01306]MCX4725524.1 PDDEXK nuclease domain-containing protein [Streptomyces sp. NBC_01306]WSX43167.1 PDDEXK nuclease domain-containing protein [Streptomyces sp. NBC_00963]